VLISKIHELVSGAWSYPVPWVWIGWDVDGLVGLFGAVGLVIGFRLKREALRNAKRP
jgi:hypothetical protein